MGKNRPTREERTRSAQAPQAQGRVGNAPARADAMLSAALDLLEQKEAPLTHDLLEQARSLAPRLPSHYLPDFYLVQPLLGDDAPRAGLVLSNIERNYLNHLSHGRYLQDAGITPALEPESYDLLCGLATTSTDIEPFELQDTSFELHHLCNQAFFEQIAQRHELGSTETEGPLALLRAFAASGIRCRAMLEREDDQLVAYIAPIKFDPRTTFANAPYRNALRSLLREAGCTQASIDGLDKLSATCGVQGFSVASGIQTCAVLADVASIKLRWESGQLIGASAIVRISDRVPTSNGGLLKPGIAYQWHITDNCDQRCKHCYLFAEDALKRCVSTPWDQLMHTLGEVERSAARRGQVPTLAISGGDPILHPRFWDFARELHARGIEWSAMGNPFHLDEEVCLHLRQLGCTKYQMSLDGLEPFHDYLRKPGSFRATLTALEPLRQAGIATQLMATASRQNLGDILACMDIAAERGASSFAFARYCATSPEKAAELYPAPEEYRAFLLAYHHKKQAYEQAGCTTVFKEKDHLFTLLRWELGEWELPAWAREDASNVYAGCHLGAKCTIAANGDLLACRRMESVVGNIRRNRLYETDRGEAMAAYADPSDIKRCKDCELMAWCRGCRAVGVNATGDLQAADPMCWHELPKA